MGEQERVKKLIEDGGYVLHNIFNMDETGLFYGYGYLLRKMNSMLM